MPSRVRPSSLGTKLHSAIFHFKERHYEIEQPFKHRLPHKRLISATESQLRLPLVFHAREINTLMRNLNGPLAPFHSGLCLS